MPSLSEFQESFVRGLTAAVPPRGIFARPEFAVYRNTWRKALIEALRGNYPVISALIGPEAFQALALAFIGKPAAPSPILAAYGLRFADFIADHPLSDSLPYLRDIAGLERLATEAHLAADAEPIDADEFVPVVRAKVGRGASLHPAARFAWFETPAVTIWKAHQEPGGFGFLEPDWVAEGVLVTRPAGRVAVMMIDRETYRLLSAIDAGETLGATVAAAVEVGPQAETMAALRRLAENGAFVNVSTRED